MDIVDRRLEEEAETRRNVVVVAKTWDARWRGEADASVAQENAEENPEYFNPGVDQIENARRENQAEEE